MQNRNAVNSARKPQPTLIPIIMLDCNFGSGGLGEGLGDGLGGVGTRPGTRASVGVT